MSDKAKRSHILKAAEIVRKGGLVGFPTETVYGIAADLSNKKAMARLDKIKKRPKGKPYTIHVGYKKDILVFNPVLTKTAKKLIRKYLPGPLTVILKSKEGKNIGFRMPDNKIALAFLRAVGRPVAAPSANISGEKSPVAAEEVCDGLDYVLNGGRTKYGVDSTIIDLSVTPPRLVRQGCLKMSVI